MSLKTRLIRRINSFQNYNLLFLEGFRRNIIILLLLIASVLALFANVAQGSKKLVVAADYWCPYNCNPESNYPGFLIELLNEALVIYDIKIEYKTIPWHEALRKVKNGEIDGIVGISNLKGQELITTKLPLEYSTLAIFTRQDTDWSYDGFQSLRGKKIGIIMDYDLDEDINNFIGMNYVSNPSMFVVEDGMNAVSDSITNLIDGNIDLYIEDINVVESYLEKNNVGRYIKNIGKISKDRLPLYVAFNKNVPNIDKYIKFIEEGLASLKSTGEYDYLREKYKIDNHH